MSSQLQAHYKAPVVCPGYWSICPHCLCHTAWTNWLCTVWSHSRWIQWVIVWSFINIIYNDLTTCSSVIFDHLLYINSTTVINTHRYEHDNVTCSCGWDLRLPTIIQYNMKTAAKSFETQVYLTIHLILFHGAFTKTAVSDWVCHSAVRLCLPRGRGG